MNLEAHHRPSRGVLLGHYEGYSLEVHPFGFSVDFLYRLSTGESPDVSEAVMLLEGQIRRHYLNPSS